MPAMNHPRILAFLVLPLAAVATLLAVGWWLLDNGQPGGRNPAPTPTPEPITASSPHPEPPKPPPPEVEFERTFAATVDEAARMKLIESLPEKTWATATNSVLTGCMQRESSPALRSKAFDVALDLAKRPNGVTKAAVLKVALDSLHADVRSRSLRECRIDPQPEMLDELLSAARMGGTDRYLAVHALAALEDPRAQQCVLEAAKDESLPKPERARAIALLARSKLPHSIDYLKELAATQDSEFAGVAIEALAAIQAAQTGSK